MGKAYVVTSGKGGVGKSTITCLFACAFLRAGFSVAVVDADAGMQSLDIMLGAENQVVFDLVDVQEGTATLKQALVKIVPDGRLCLLSSAQMRSTDATSSEAMRAVTDELKQRFDIVLIDGPSGVDRGFVIAATGADEALVVATQDPISLRHAERVIGRLEKCDILLAWLIVNRASGEDESAEAWGIDAAERIGARYLGRLSEDARIRSAYGGNFPAAAMMLPIWKDVCDAAARLTGANDTQPQKPPVVKWRISRFFAWLDGGEDNGF